MGDHDMHSSKELREHVSSHVTYPASKAQILMACHTGETPEDVLKAAEMHLQDKTYNSAAEVLQDLHMT